MRKRTYVDFHQAAGGRKPLEDSGFAQGRVTAGKP